MKKSILLLPALLGIVLSSCGSGEETTSSQITSQSTSFSSSTSSIPTDGVETFKQARKQTAEATQYQYDFAVNAKIKYKSAASFTPATYSGTTYVDTSKTTSFLQERNISGALVIDSTSYIYNIGSDLIKISADEDKDFSVINHETISDIASLDKNNFGYILKKMNDADILKAEYKNGKYELSIQTNFSQDSLLSLLNFIDSKTILKALSNYTKQEWGVGFTVNAWATLTSDKMHLSKFHFDAAVDIKDTVEIGFELEQSFVKYSNVQITLPKFDNTINEEAAIKNELNNANTIFNNSMKAATSYYDYSVKTTVDHGVSKGNPLGLAVNSTTKGYTKRQILNNKVYFNNRLLVDSDYKNKDQLGNLVEDYDSYRARLNDGKDTVYDVLDPKVGTNKYYALDNYDESNIDEYYMMPRTSLLSIDSIKIIKKTTNKKNNNVYKFGLSSDAVKTILSNYNESFRIDFERKTIFDIYKINSDFEAKKALFTVEYTQEGKIVSINIDLKGFYAEKESNDHVKFRLEVSLDYNWNKSYTAVSKKEDIDNN